MDKKVEQAKIIPKNKIPQTKICGVLITDSKNIPATKERQRKNNILEALICQLFLNSQILKYGEISFTILFKNSFLNGFIFSTSTKLKT